jgi:hypothetical protein
MFPVNSFVAYLAFPYLCRAYPCLTAASPPSLSTLSAPMRPLRACKLFNSYAFPSLFSFSTLTPLLSRSWSLPHEESIVASSPSSGSNCITSPYWLLVRRFFSLPYLHTKLSFTPNEQFSLAKPEQPPKPLSPSASPRRKRRSSNSPKTSACPSSLAGSRRRSKPRSE